MYRTVAHRVKLLRAGFIRSTIDCVIAVLAEQNECALLARDRDMEMILTSGVLPVERWPALESE